MADTERERSPRPTVPGTKLIEYDTFYAHPDLPKRSDGKNIPLWKTINDREIEPKEWEDTVQSHLAGREAQELKGFINSKGEPFSSRIEFRKQGDDLVVGFPLKNKGVELNTKCPKTGEPMTKHTFIDKETGKPKAYFRAPGFPGLTLWGEVHGRPMSAGDYRRILEPSLKGEAGPEMYGFKKADGSTYSMRLIVTEQEGKYAIARFQEETKLKYERTGTGINCPISGKEIMDSGKYLYSTAYPRLLFPKELRGKKFDTGDFVEQLKAWAKGEKGPKYWFTSKDGTSHYEAWLVMDEKQHYVNLEYVEKFDKAQRPSAPTPVQGPVEKEDAGIRGDGAEDELVMDDPVFNPAVGAHVGM